MSGRWRACLAALFILGALSALHAEEPPGQIDTVFLEQPWPKQRVREYEVHTYAVRWRQRASKQEGIFAGAGFTAPARLEDVWALTTDFTDLGTMSPAVERVEIVENTPTRQVVVLTAKVLWKRLRLRFEVEKDPPRTVRFRLLNPRLGEYRGVCRLQPDGERTGFEISTWLKTPVPVSPRMILWAERVILLDGIREFLLTCEGLSPATGST